MKSIKVTCPIFVPDMGFILGMTDTLKMNGKLKYL